MDSNGMGEQSSFNPRMIKLKENGVFFESLLDIWIGNARGEILL
jgi:hypothetical protein